MNIDNRPIESEKPAPVCSHGCGYGTIAKPCSTPKCGGFSCHLCAIHTNRPEAEGDMSWRICLSCARQQVDPVDSEVHEGGDEVDEHDSEEQNNAASFLSLFDAGLSLIISYLDREDAGELATCSAATLELMLFRRACAGCQTRSLHLANARVLSLSAELQSLRHQCQNCLIHPAFHVSVLLGIPDIFRTLPIGTFQRHVRLGFKGRIGTKRKGAAFSSS